MNAVESLASHFSLNEEEKSKLLPSGQQPIFYNRVGWARTYLKKARLIDDPPVDIFGLQTVEKKFCSEIQIALI